MKTVVSCCLVDSWSKICEAQCSRGPTEPSSSSSSSSWAAAAAGCCIQAFYSSSSHPAGDFLSLKAGCAFASLDTPLDNNRYIGC
jgi:hypothetical protein